MNVSKSCSKYLHLPIHMHIGLPIVDCSSGKAVVRPIILDGRDIPVRITLRTHALALVQEWELNSSRSFSIILSKEGFAVLDCTDSPVRGKFSPPPTQVTSLLWHVLEMRVTDPVTGEYHAPYVIMTTTDAARAAWDAYCDNRLGLNCAADRSSTALTVHIAARNIMAFDAVGNYTTSLAAFLRSMGWDVKLYSHDMSPCYAGLVSSLALLPERISSGDVVFYQYSITDGFLNKIADIKNCRKILYYHGVTPGFWFRKYQPDFADLLDAAQAQYSVFSHFDAVITNSQYSLEQIFPYLSSDVPSLIFPPYFSLKRVCCSETPLEDSCDTHYNLLWIGRIVPHKRPDLALRVFNALIRSDVDASLTFVGGGRYDFPVFAEHMGACLAALDPTSRNRVQFLQGMSDKQLTWLYHHSSLLLCTSAHEGYCMPLVEAAACNLPVAAMPQPAVMETLGGRGLILDEDPQKAARQIRDFLVNNDEEERRRATPVVPDLPTGALLRLILGDE